MRIYSTNFSSLESQIFYTTKITQLQAPENTKDLYITVSWLLTGQLGAQAPLGISGAGLFTHRISILMSNQQSKSTDEVQLKTICLYKLTFPQQSSCSKYTNEALKMANIISHGILRINGVQKTSVQSIGS